MYIFEINSKEDFDYTMYHYGPYSSKVEDFVDIAEALRLLKIEWILDKGYSINPLNKSSGLLIEIEKEEKRKIEKIAEKFGKLDVNELSIITTALYIKNNFKVSKPSSIINTILLLKPKYQKNQLKQLLKKANILMDSVN